MIKDRIDAVLDIFLDEASLQNRIQKLQKKIVEVPTILEKKIISEDLLEVEQPRQRIKGESIYDRNTKLQGINEKVQTNMQRIEELTGTTKTGSIFERVHDTMKGTI